MLEQTKTEAPIMLWRCRVEDVFIFSLNSDIFLYTLTVIKRHILVVQM